MPTRALRTEIEIAAPVQRVWDVLADVERWSEWNPVLEALRLRGPLQEGTRGTLVLALPSPVRTASIPVRLISVRPPHSLAWQGGTAGLMTGRHGFELSASRHGTRVVHTEVFEGLLAPLVLAVAHRPLMQGYRRLNRALRERCEQA